MKKLILRSIMFDKSQLEAVLLLTLLNVGAVISSLPVRNWWVATAAILLYPSMAFLYNLRYYFIKEYQNEHK